MSFVEVVTTTRLRMNPRRALAAWERTKGICVTCDRKIDGVKERWFVEHIRALELGGEDTDANLGPAHYDTCKRVKDADDHHRAAAAKRAKRRQLGIKPKSRLQGAGFAKAPPQRRASTPLNKWRGDQP